MIYRLLCGIFLLVCAIGSAHAQSYFIIKKYVAGRYYVSVGPRTAAGTAAGQNKINCYYTFFPTNVTLTTVGGYVTTTSAAKNFQFGIYSNSSGVPGSLIASSASLSTTTATGVTGSLTATIQLGPTGSSGGPDLWICSNSDNTTSAYQSSGTGNTTLFSGGHTVGATSLTNLVTNTWSPASISCAGANCQGSSSTFNTWPASLATSTWTIESASIAAIMAFLVDSSP